VRVSVFNFIHRVKRAQAGREELLSVAVLPFKLAADDYYPTAEICGPTRMQGMPLETGTHQGKPSYRFSCVDKNSGDRDFPWREHYFDVHPQGLGGGTVIRVKFTHSILDVDNDELREQAVKAEIKKDLPAGLKAFKALCASVRPAK
jgi:hypothetical protein